MKRFTVFTIAAALTVGFGATQIAADEGQDQTPTFVDENGDGLPDDPMAQTANSTWGPGLHGVFIDEDGDGVNDLSQDADGDGIVNGLDQDYLNQKGIATGRGWMGHGFVDEDGDGVNDLSQDADGDGIPNGIDADYTLPEGTVLQSFGGRGGMMGGFGGFIDEDGDGVNDLMQDADGDGIANGLDPDYVRPAGVQIGRFGHGGGMMGGAGGFVDEDGDGVNDLMQDADGDGIANGLDSDYVRPEGVLSGRFGHGGGMMGGFGGFVDENGDGINDLMLDVDSDGIPNGMDADYALPEGVTRGRFGGGHGMGHFNGFLDEDGDGVNDLMQDADADGIPNGLDPDYALPEGVTPAHGGMGGQGGMMGGRGGMGGWMNAPGTGANATPTSDGEDMAQRVTDGTAVNPTGQTGTNTTGVQNQGQMGTGRGQMGSGNGMMGGGRQQGRTPVPEEEQEKPEGN